ncbi:MAG TPA: hypothetical protein VF380_09340, partial [Solirubrobacteraceae bacterium]
MSAPAAGAPAASAPAAAGRLWSAASGRQSLRLRLGSFFALAAFASLEYSSLLLHPPTVRVLGVVAITTAGAATLALSLRISSILAGTVLRIALVLAMLYLGLLAVGIPAHLLAPARWGALGGDARRGLHAIGAGLWPYRGASAWARLVVLAVLPVGVGLAGAVSFWPSRRGERVRPLVSLSTLVALLVVGVVNQTGAAWRVQGVVLLAVLAAWLWLPTLERGGMNRAACWLLACVVPALLLAPALSAVGPWIGLRTAAAPLTSSFQWDQTYGPIPWSRSTATMFEIAEQQPALLKVTSLDRFDGLRFVCSPSPPGSSRLDLGRAPAAAAGYVRATVTIAGLRSNLLVSGGGEPLRVSWLGAAPPTPKRSRDGTIALAAAPAGGARYGVLSYAPAASATTLRRAGRSFPRAYLPYARFELPRAGASALAPPAAAAAQTGRLVGAPTPGRAPASDRSMARGIADSPYASMFALARLLAAGRRSSFD